MTRRHYMPAALHRAWRQVCLVCLLWAMHDSRHRQRELERQMAADRENLHRMRVQVLHDTAKAAALRMEIEVLKQWPR